MKFTFVYKKVSRVFDTRTFRLTNRILLLLVLTLYFSIFPNIYESSAIAENKRIANNSSSRILNVHFILYFEHFFECDLIVINTISILLIVLLVNNYIKNTFAHRSEVSFFNTISIRNIFIFKTI